MPNPQIISQVPFYLDWTFWSFVIASIALIASQENRLRALLKKAKIEFEIHTNIAIGQKIGMPNIQLFIDIFNSGGKTVRVTGIDVEIIRDREHIDTLGAKLYFNQPTDTSSVLFRNFSIPPGKDWAHQIQFYNNFKLSEEKKYNDILHSIKCDIDTRSKQLTEQKKENESIAKVMEKISNDIKDENIRVDILESIEEYRKKNPEIKYDESGYIEASTENTQLAIEMFNSNFIWVAGEYEFKITIKTQSLTPDQSKSIKFTLFEYHENILRKPIEELRWGAGLYWNNNATPQYVFPRVQSVE